MQHTQFGPWQGNHTHPYKATTLLLVSGDSTVEEVLENIFHMGQSSK